MTASIFDDMISGQPADTAETEAETTDAATEGTETNASDAKTVVTLPVGQRPEGAVQISEFADLVNKELVAAEVQRLMETGKTVVEAAVEAMNVTVSPATFYQAVKAQRNPIPHIEARYEVPVLDENGQDTGEVKTDTKIFIPVKEGLEFWKNRPTRGAGGAARSEEDVTSRLLKAGKKRAALKAAEARKAKLDENIERMKTQLAKYTEWLAADGKTLEDADAAFEAQQESEEAENAIDDNE